MKLLLMLAPGIQRLIIGRGFLIRQNIHDDVNCCRRIRNDGIRDSK